MHERPGARLLVLLEEREVEHPVEDVEVRVDQVELPAEVQAQQPEHAQHGGVVPGAEEHGRPWRRLERRQLGRREELGDRRAHLAALVHDDVGEALRAPLLRQLLEALDLAAGERLRRDDEANRLGVLEDAELGARASPRSRPGSRGRSAGRACRSRSASSPRRTRSAGTGAAAPRGRAPRTTRRPPSPSRRARPRARRTPSRGRAGGTRTAGRRGDPRHASTWRSGSSGRTRRPCRAA